MKILLDEMYDGLADLFEAHDYEVHRVSVLKKTDPKFAHDFNVILHAKAEDLVIVTADNEIGKACKDNDVKCIFVGFDTIFQRIVLPEVRNLEAHKSM